MKKLDSLGFIQAYTRAAKKFILMIFAKIPQE
jgi:hypothetical protein